MKEKNIKLIMEMIFIFILPLMFILPAIKITDNYIYDNNGNYASSDKSISYDSIGYNDYYKNYLDFNQLINITNSTGSISGIDYSISNGIINATGTATADDTIVFGYFQLPLGDKYFINYNIVSVNGIYRVGDFNNGFSISTDYTGAFYVIDSGVTLALQFYSGQSFNIIYFYNIFNLTQMFGSGYEPSTIEELSNYIDLSVYHNYTESDEIIFASDEPIAKSNILVKSVVANLKELISNVLLIDNNNVVFNLVVDYCGLWLIMFVVWHLLYAILDFIVHLVRIRKRE